MHYLASILSLPTPTLFANSAQRRDIVLTPVTEKKKREAEGQSSEDASNNKDKEEQEITLRPLNMEDMREAKTQVAASFASEGSVMNELKHWNDLYGEGGSRKKQQLTYFL
ncbi:hypothetical protein JHK87_045507 [Glycine soja]|nr:hypothetical protein JHK87_045507 [Glycine soja]